MTQGGGGSGGADTQAPAQAATQPQNAATASASPPPSPPQTPNTGIAGPASQSNPVSTDSQVPTMPGVAVAPVVTNSHISAGTGTLTSDQQPPAQPNQNQTNTPNGGLMAAYTIGPIIAVILILALVRHILLKRRDAARSTHLFRSNSGGKSFLVAHIEILDECLTGYTVTGASRSASSGQHSNLLTPDPSLYLSDCGIPWSTPPQCTFFFFCSTQSLTTKLPSLSSRG